MRKLIDIPGKLNEKGTVANKLNIMAAEVGTDLKNYIQDILTVHVRTKDKISQMAKKLQLPTDMCNR